MTACFMPGTSDECLTRITLFLIPILWSHLIYSCSVEKNRRRKNKKQKTDLRFTEVKGLNQWQGRTGTQIQTSALPPADALTDDRGSVSAGSARGADVVDAGRVASASGMLSPRGQGQGAPGKGRVSPRGGWTRRPRLWLHELHKAWGHFRSDASLDTRHRSPRKDGLLPRQCLCGVLD